MIRQSRITRIINTYYSILSFPCTYVYYTTGRSRCKTIFYTHGVRRVVLLHLEVFTSEHCARTYQYNNLLLMIENETQWAAPAAALTRSSK